MYSVTVNMGNSDMFSNSASVPEDSPWMSEMGC